MSTIADKDDELKGHFIVATQNDKYKRFMISCVVFGVRRSCCAYNIIERKRDSCTQLQA